MVFGGFFISRRVTYFKSKASKAWIMLAQQPERVCLARAALYL